MRHVLVLCCALAYARASLTENALGKSERFLRGGGDQFLRRHLELPDAVSYNPLSHMSRDDAAGAGALSDVDLLRALGYYVPGHDDDHTLVTSGRLAMRTSMRRSDVNIRGEKSMFMIHYKGAPPAAARNAFEYAMQIWANTFVCSVPLRVSFQWAKIKGRTLAAAVSPFTVGLGALGARSLRADTAYTPTMAAAVAGVDFTNGRFHIEIAFNSEQPWHFDTDRPARRNQFDFATVAIHEGCHGLFFTGALLGASSSRTARFESFRTFPSRFDQFMQTSNGVGVARSCNSQGLFKALTTPGLSFLTIVRNSTFALYAPPNYQQGSSTYHFDANSLDEDCRRASISKADCSNLMTFELDTGYTQHAIGQPTLRVMQSILSDSLGIVESQCIIPPPLQSSNSRRPGLLGQSEAAEALNLPAWVIATAASVAAVGAVVVVYFIVTALIR